MNFILYHVTPKANLPSIRRKGLVAQCGDCCVGLNANRPGVYLWGHRAAAEGNPFGGRRHLKGKVVLEVELPEQEIRCLKRDWEFLEDETEAWVYPFDVPPSWIWP